MSFASKMPDPNDPRTLPTLSSHVDYEELAESHPKKRRLPSFFLWFVRTVLRFPFSSTILLYLVLAGATAGVAKWSYGLGVRDPESDLQPNKDGIALIGNSYRVDIPNRTLSVTWSVRGCGEYSRLGTKKCDVCNRAVDVYLNGLSGQSTPIFSYEPARFPPAATGSIFIFVLDTFTMDFDLGSSTRDMVPFDVYSISALVFVIERDTNVSLPVITFEAAEGTSGFAISSFATSKNSSWTYDPGSGPTTVVVDSSLIDITVKRSRLAQAFTLCLLIINSALTVGSAYITFLTLVRREAVNDSVLLLPVTVVLVIPALRGLYVGSPPFGIYLDSFGFFLQMVTVAVCSMVLLYAITMPRAVPMPTAITAPPTGIHMSPAAVPTSPTVFSTSPTVFTMPPPFTMPAAHVVERPPMMDHHLGWRGSSDSPH